MKLIVILIMTLAVSGTLQVESPIPYRVLRVFLPSDYPSRRYIYYVSVPKFLDRPSIEGLICSVIEKEAPPLGFPIGISVYQGIERISGAEFVFGNQHPGRDMAIFGAGEGRSGGLLTLLRDSQGVEIRPPASFEFDYPKLCRK